MVPKEEMADRLLIARKAAGFTSARAAALEHGWVISTYNAHENGQNGFKPEDAEKYASAYRVSAGWLLTGEGEGPRVVPGMRYVQVIGHVQAGEWRESFEWPPDDQFPVGVPREGSNNANYFGLEVRGPSMDRIYREGTVVVCEYVRGQVSAPQPKKRYVVERVRADGLRETTLKAVAADQDGKLWLVPESNDPRYSQSIPIDGEDGDTIEFIGRVRYSVIPEE